MSLMQTMNEYLDLKKDQEEPHLIDQTIRSSVRLVGTNLWVLFFAILVASVGLNVNSTAVIIGAMLISPLMGPIVGIGYGTGINDFELIKLSIKNYLIFTFISLLASTLYFVLSPLDTPQSELLARTSPTLWDVLIAFFGGSAGIIALTRKSISNVVPGVAIATALMPPLCTAGFGVAQANWQFFGGALFLYLINSVFIAFSTLLFVKLFKLPKLKHLDNTTQKRTYMVIALTLLITILPSAYLAIKFVEQSRYQGAVNSVLDNVAADPDVVLLDSQIDSKSGDLYVTVGGENAPKNLDQRIENLLRERGFDRRNVIVRTTGAQVDFSALKGQLQQELYSNLQTQVDSLSEENEGLKLRLGAEATLLEDQAELIKELKVMFPTVADVAITTGVKNSADAASLEPQTSTESAVLTLVTVEAGPSGQADRTRLKQWMQLRFGGEVKILYVPRGALSS